MKGAEKHEAAAARPGDGHPAGPTEAAVRRALEKVIDPEVGLDVVTMGMVYGVEIDRGEVTVRYTLTTPGCPMEGPITQGIVAVVSALEGVTGVNAELVWEPAWNPGMIRADAW